MTPVPSPHTWQYWLETVESDGVNLTSWEEEFIASLREKANRWGDSSFLSERQLEQLERIYTERTP